MITKIVPIEEWNNETDTGSKFLLLCSGNSYGVNINDDTTTTTTTTSHSVSVIDFLVIKFNHEQYLLCLVNNVSINNQQQQHSEIYTLNYGPLDGQNWQPKKQFRLEINNMKRPKKLLAFVNNRNNGKMDEDYLIILLLNDGLGRPNGNENNNNYNIDTGNGTIGTIIDSEINIKWLKINTNNVLIRQNHLDNLRHISSTNVALWRAHNIFIVHDLLDGMLKMFKFVETYFDLVEFTLPVENDLNAICAFTLSGISYLALGYRNEQRPKDVAILRYNDYLKRLEYIQAIQCNEKVIAIEYFLIGYGINQENFLAIIQTDFIVFYKFLKSKREFIVFQRIQSAGQIRRVITYGDTNRLFVMAVILASNDLYFITYNSLRFIHSPINLHIIFHPTQPINLYRISKTTLFNNGNYQSMDKMSENDAGSVQLMLGGQNGIRLYDVRFYNDKNLFKLWTDHLKWCHSKRTEIGELEKHTTIINKRFTESYFKSEPLVIHGTLSVPYYSGNVIETKDYRSLYNDNLMLNEEYFNELNSIQEQLNLIEYFIQNGHQTLSNAVLINTAQIQTITGNYSFTQLPVNKYDGNNDRKTNSLRFHGKLNLITDYLNGKDVRYLFADVIKLNKMDDLKLYQPISIRTIDLTNDNTGLFVWAPANERYNLSNIVTNNAEQIINGHKRFHQSLIVDNTIYTDRINGKEMNKNKVLMLTGDQLVQNPIELISKKLHSGTVNVKNINNFDFVQFVRSAVRKNEPVPLSMPIEFTNDLLIEELTIDDGGRMNNENIRSIYNDALWLDRSNQTIFGDYSFRSNISIMGNLNLNRINNKNVPEDLILANRLNIITGQKTFQNHVFIQNLNVTQTLNGLAVINGL